MRSDEATPRAEALGITEIAHVRLDGLPADDEPIVRRPLDRALQFQAVTTGCRAKLRHGFGNRPLEFVLVTRRHVDFGQLEDHVSHPLRFIAAASFAAYLLARLAAAARAARSREPAAPAAAELAGVGLIA